jgi:hypothetical protein
MPDINFDCPFCKQNLDAPEDMTGMNIECPSCSKAIRIPAPLHIHYPIKKTLGPQPASGPKIFASKTEASSGGVSGEAPASAEVKAKTAKIEIPPEALTPANMPRHSRIIVIKRAGK